MSDASEPLEQITTSPTETTAGLEETSSSKPQPPAKPVKASTPPALDSANAGPWDYCEIVYHPARILSNYAAYVNGPDGPYVAAVSRSVENPRANEDPARKHNLAVNELAQKLRADGWEPVPTRGPHWFSHRFRRATSRRGAILRRVDVLQPNLAAAAHKALTDLAPLARRWVDKAVAASDGEAHASPAQAVAPSSHAAAQMATPPPSRRSLAHLSSDPSVIILGPATDGQTAPVPGQDHPLSGADAAGHIDPSGATQGAGNQDISLPSLSQQASDFSGQNSPEFNLGAGLRAGAQLLAADHAAHLAYRRANQDDGYLDHSAGYRVRLMVARYTQRLWTYCTVVIEMIPGFPGEWYGPGDIVTAIEAFVGTTMDGLHLSLVERILYFGASALPAVPARPVVGVYRRVEPWLRSEDTLAQRASSAGALHRGIGIAGSAGWGFLMSQLPPWLRHEMADPFADQSIYPRSKVLQRVRDVAASAWVPATLCFGVIAAHLIGGPFHITTTLDRAPIANILPDLTLPWGANISSALVVGLVTFIAGWIIAVQARRDRLREELTLAIRDAHVEVVGRVNETMWSRGVPVTGKMTQSFLHLQDVSLKTAKHIMWEVLMEEAKHLTISLAIAVVAFVIGVTLALVGLV